MKAEAEISIFKVEKPEAQMIEKYFESFTHDEGSQSMAIKEEVLYGNPIMFTGNLSEPLAGHLSRGVARLGLKS